MTTDTGREVDVEALVKALESEDVTREECAQAAATIRTLQSELERKDAALRDLMDGWREELNDTAALSQTERRVLLSCLTDLRRALAPEPDPEVET